MKRHSSIVGSTFLCLVPMTLTLPPASSDESQSRDASLPIFEVEQGTEDELPSEATRLVSVAQISESSVRFLGETDSARFWAAKNYSGDTCLISRLSDESDGHVGDAEILGGNCTPTDVALRSGVVMKLEGAEGTAVSMHMLSEELSAEGSRALNREMSLVGGEVIQRGGTTLAVVPSDKADGVSGLLVEADSGHSIELELISE